MKLVIEKNLLNNNYEVIFNIEDITPEEQELMNDFSIPTIDVGGELKATDDIEVLATLGSSYKKIPSQMPFSKIFSSSVYGAKTQAVADSYAKATQVKIEAAIAELKAKEDGFSGTTEVIL
jgi:hypothetical protein